MNLLLLSSTLWTPQTYFADRFTGHTDDSVWGKTSGTETTTFDASGLLIDNSMTCGMFASRS